MGSVTPHSFWLKFIPGSTRPSLIGASNGSVLVMVLRSFATGVNAGRCIDKMPAPSGQEIRSRRTGLMRIDQTNVRRAPTLIAMALALLAVGAGEPSPRVTPFLGQRAADVLVKADRG